MIETVSIIFGISVLIFTARLVNLYGRSAFEAGEYGGSSKNKNNSKRAVLTPWYMGKIS